jgi:hypothetical protein
VESAKLPEVAVVQVLVVIIGSPEWHQWLAVVAGAEWTHPAIFLKPEQWSKFHTWGLSYETDSPDEIAIDARSRPKSQVTA